MPGGLDMSFSGEVKEELQKQVAAARHCQIAELASILHFCGSYRAADETYNQDEEKKSSAFCEMLLIQAENEAVIRKCFTLLQKTFNINTSVNEKRVGKSGRPGVNGHVDGVAAAGAEPGGIFYRSLSRCGQRYGERGAVAGAGEYRHLPAAQAHHPPHDGQAQPVAPVVRIRRGPVELVENVLVLKYDRLRSLL